METIPRFQRAISDNVHLSREPSSARQISGICQVEVFRPLRRQSHRRAAPMLPSSSSIHRLASSPLQTRKIRRISFRNLILTLILFHFKTVFYLIHLNIHKGRRHIWQSSKLKRHRTQADDQRRARFE